MVRACAAIRSAGGAERVNSFTRYYLALLGVISYKQCPAVPPELILIPDWAPFNIYEMSAWSRTIVIPLSILWAYRPARQCRPRWESANSFCTPPKIFPSQWTNRHRSIR
jgi:squalene-hopene/tetraprenyl-beta-curcumene cyclase